MNVQHRLLCRTLSGNQIAPFQRCVFFYAVNVARARWPVSTNREILP
jgi:hypothetical protein